MCEPGLSAASDSSAITICWTTKHKWDTGYASAVIDGYRRDYPKARSITLCVNGEHAAGWVGHG